MVASLRGSVFPSPVGRILRKRGPTSADRRQHLGAGGGNHAHPDPILRTGDKRIGISGHHAMVDFELNIQSQAATIRNGAG